MSKANELVTERIIALLERDIVPWRQEWSNAAGLGEHQNLISQHQYRGINALMTSAMGFEQPFWLSYKQATDLGGQVKKGEKSTPIVYWAFGATKDDNDVEKRWAYAKYSNVFNVAQIECPKLDAILKRHRKAERINFNPIESCESVIRSYETMPKLKHDEQRAYYRPSQDLINMPKKDSFTSEHAYYQTLFHEMTHSTGHASRLNRLDVVKNLHFGSEEYSKEELVAELGSAFLCAKAGIDANSIERSAAYIKSWLKALKNDSTLVLSAASKAQKAFDLISGLKNEKTVSD